MGTLLFLNMFTLKILPPCHNHTPHKQQIRNNNQSITRHIYTCSTVDRLGRRWVGNRNSQKMDEWSSQFLHTALPTTVHRLNLGISNGSLLVLLKSQLHIMYIQLTAYHVVSVLLDAQNATSTAAWSAKRHTNVGTLQHAAIVYLLCSLSFFCCHEIHKSKATGCPSLTINCNLCVKNMCTA